MSVSYKNLILSGASLGVLGSLLLAGPAFAQNSFRTAAAGTGLGQRPSRQEWPQPQPAAGVHAFDQPPGHAPGGQCHRPADHETAGHHHPGRCAAQCARHHYRHRRRRGRLPETSSKIRGFDAKDDVYLDGLRDFGAYARDSFNYEEVQVLKGPSGLMFGRGYHRWRHQHHLQISVSQGSFFGGARGRQWRPFSCHRRSQLCLF